jgi:hypothetical protein
VSLARKPAGSRAVSEGGRGVRRSIEAEGWRGTTSINFALRLLFASC